MKMVCVPDATRSEMVQQKAVASERTIRAYPVDAYTYYM
jgi:hypothetical protein